MPSLCLRAVSFVIAGVFASSASGQGPGEHSEDRIIHITQAETDRDVEGILWAVNLLVYERRPSGDLSNRSLMLDGTAGQIAMAKWLVRELDRPVKRDPAPEQRRFLTSDDYWAAQSNEDVVKVFYLSHTTRVQELQEIAVAVRMVADLRQLVTYNPRWAMVARGTESQIAVAEWLLAGLDRQTNWQTSPNPPEPPVRHEYWSSDSREEVVRMFYLTHAASAKNLQELFVGIRVITDISWAFPYNTARAILMRGPEGNVGVAEWLFNQLNQAANWPPLSETAPATGAYEFRGAFEGTSAVRVFYLPRRASESRVQYFVNRIRRGAFIPRTFYFATSRALMMRGTPAQIAQAERTFEEVLGEAAP